MNSKDKSDEELADQLGSSTYKDKERACREVTQRVLQTLWAQHPEGVTWDNKQDDHELKIIIARCARLLASLRGVVTVYTERSSFGAQDENYRYTEPTIEKPDRINQLLYNLCRGHAVASGRTHLTNDDIRYAIEIAVDSAQTTRTKILRQLLDVGGELSTSQVGVLLNCSKPTALKEMKTLKILGLCQVIQKSQGKVGEPEMTLRLNDKFKWFLNDECRAIRGLEPINKEDLTLWDVSK